MLRRSAASTRGLASQSALCRTALVYSSPFNVCVKGQTRGFNDIVNASEVSKASSTVPPALTSPLYDYRRLKTRSAWKQASKELDPDFVVFPRERLGRDYTLNWTLCKYAVIPNVDGEAFRNLHTRGLLMYSDAKPDGNKAMHLDLGDAGGYVHHVLPSAKPKEGTPDVYAAPKNIAVINEAQTRETAKHVRRWLSEGRTIFVHDGALGSHPSAALNIRFICDSATTALSLSHLIPRVPTTPPDAFEEAITVFLATGLKLDLNRVGVSASQGTVLNMLDNKIYLAGTKTMQAVEEAVAALATHQFALKGAALPFPGEAVLTPSGQPVLVASPFGPSNAKELFGAHVQLWTGAGVSHLFNGATFADVDSSSKLKRGDVVEVTKTGRRVTTGLKRPNIAPHPAAIVFVTPDQAKSKSSVSKISKEEAVKLYLGAFNYPLLVKDDLLRERLGALLDAHKVTAYHVTGPAPKTNKIDYAELQKLLH
jgi:hypothetical protein